MYLSKIFLNPLSKMVNRELENPYEMHRTVMSAFPDGVDRKTAKVLYRVETPQIFPKTEDSFLLVQSNQEPVWAFLTQRKNYLSGRKPENWQIKSFTPALKKNQLLKFRLLANPTKRHAKNKKINPIVLESELMEWLTHKGRLHGFLPLVESILINRLLVEQFLKNPKENSNPLTIHKVNFDGYLQITDAEKIMEALQSGIGRSRAFGCGLLSLARV